MFCISCFILDTTFSARFKSVLMVRVYFRPLLGAIIAPNALSLVLKKIFILGMSKNGICLGDARKQDAHFF